MTPLGGTGQLAGSPLEAFAEIDRSCDELLTSPARLVDKLVACRSGAEYANAPFLNVSFSQCLSAIARAGEVQSLTAAALDDELRRKAHYQALHRLHSTIVRVDSEVSGRLLWDLFRNQLGTELLDYELHGPHLTPDLVVVIELRPTSNCPEQLRQIAYDLLAGKGYAVTRPGIHHITIARIKEAQPEQVELLSGVLKRARSEYPIENVRGSGVVAARDEWYELPSSSSRISSGARE